MQSKPWKEIGYRGFSAFLASDNEFLIFRRFGSLNTRLLLYSQDKIAVLEEALEALEANHAREGAIDIHNGSFRQEALPERKRLLEELNTEVRQYSKCGDRYGCSLLLTHPDELLLLYSALRSHPSVPKRSVESVSNWLYNAQNAILDKEVSYIGKKSDLVQLVPMSKTPLRQLLEKWAWFRRANLWKKTPPDLPAYTSAYPGTVHYSSDARIDRFIGVTVTLLGLAMLIAPLWTLAYTGTKYKRMSIITGFIVLFLGLLAFTTVAKPFESLAAAAAYSAILVVFLQIGSG